jgi:HK97 family phage major capsid protein
MRIMAPVATAFHRRTPPLIGFTKRGRPVYGISGGAPTLAELEKEGQEVIREAQGIVDALNGDAPSEEQATKLRTLDGRYKELYGDGDQNPGDIVRAKEVQGITDAFKTRSQNGGDGSGNPGLYSGGDPGSAPGSFRAGSGGANEPFTPGEIFVRSEQYAAWTKKFPSGPPETGFYQSEPVEFPNFSKLLGFVTETDKLRAGGMLTPAKMRSLVTSGGASAGELTRPDYRGLLEPGLVRPLTVRQLVTVIPTTTDAIEYVKESSRITGAAPVTEAIQLLHTGDTTATKPEGGLTFALVQDVVRTIAEWVPATRRILSDAPQLRAYIDSYLTDDLALELEDQIVAGSGTGVNFRGILNTVGIQVAGPPAGTNNMLDVLRTSRRLIVANARTFPTAVLINPADSESIDILKFGGATPTAYVGSGPYTSGGTFNPTIWGMNVVETEAVPAGTALVGDFRRAVLFDRENVTITVGTAGDDFIRNIVRILGEMRAGFGVIRPAAFVAADLVA